MLRFNAVLVALLALAGSAPAALADEFTDNFDSRLRAVEPTIEGLELKVVGGDRSLELRNATGETILVEGYDGEPYLRFLPSNVVEVNERSPTKFVNEDRFGLSPVPASANADAPPRWKPISRDGSYDWLDHRIHWMTREMPPQVKDRGKETKVLDWRVPMRVGNEPVRASGTLAWAPADDQDESSGVSAGLIAAVAAVALVVVAAIALLVRRRRRGGPGGNRPVGRPDAKEAW